VNLYQAFALAVVILMVASMVGYSFLTAPDTTPTEDTPPVDPDGPQIDQSQIKTFLAEGVDANVVQLFPVILVTAGTRESEINLIDQAVYGVEGVNSVNSYYKPQDNAFVQSGLIYVGTITFDPSLDKADVLDKIKTAAPIEVFDAVQTGLVKVPVELNLKAEDDASLSKEHRLDEPFMEAILSFDTQKDDLIKVSQRFVFSGEQVMQAMAFETENKTGQPVSFGVKLGDLKIVALEKAFTLGGNTSFDGSSDFSALEEKIEALEGVEKASLEVQPVFYRISLLVEKELPGKLLSDLNQALHQVEEAGTIKFWHQEEVDVISVDFEADADYAALKAGIGQAFDSAGAEYNELIDPSVNIFGELETAESVLPDLNASLYSLMQAEGFQDIELFQKALVDLETREFVGPDILLEWEAEETVTEAFITPSHQVDDLINLDLIVYGVRGKIQNINAFEEQ
jgi:hypothetical protein